MYPFNVGTVLLLVRKVSCKHIRCGLILISARWFFNSERLLMFWQFHCKMLSSVGGGGAFLSVFVLSIANVKFCCMDCVMLCKGCLGRYWATKRGKSVG